MATIKIKFCGFKPTYIKISILMFYITEIEHGIDFQARTNTIL